MVVAVAGRRIDGPDAEFPRFPLRNVAVVGKRIRSLLETHTAIALVSSAACGSDLIALGQASSMGIRCRVILPFDRVRFRATSVTDRPGDWGPVYDRLIDKVASSKDLIVCPESAEDAPAFSTVNRLILNEAETLAHAVHHLPIVVLVWDLQARGDDDLTKSFGDDARQRGMQVLSVSTLD